MDRPVIAGLAHSDETGYIAGLLKVKHRQIYAEDVTPVAACAEKPAPSPHAPKFAAASEAPASGTSAADAEMLGTARRGAEFKVAAASHNMLLISPESRSTAHATRPGVS